LEIAGGGTEIEICAGDGVSDAFDVTVTGVQPGPTAWVITDSDGIILGLPAGPPFDLEGAGEGICLIWHLSYEEGLEGAVVGNNAADLVGCYDLSNPITVTRNGVNGGDLAIEGGATEIEICAGDGVSDAFNVTLENNIGDNSLWVITDADANILATPDGPPFDLEGAGEGTCLIWHLSYDDSVSLDGVTNAGQLEGCYSLSNPITVTRIGVNGGALSRTDGIDEPFAFTVGDGVDDFIPVDAITLIENIGTNSQWVITDDAGVILELPASPYDVNFEGAEAGTCLVWHLSFEDGLEGAAVGNNAANLVGCYSLSNPLSVVRTTSSGRIALYPNPAKDKVNLDLSNFRSKNVSVRIFNIQNVQMFSRELNSRNISRTNSTSINVSNYQSGIYFVNVTDIVSGKSYIKRLIVK